MAKSKRKTGQEAGLDTNAWMITFSDLLTLLMTFFVMLLSMSSIDKNRLESLSSSLRGAVGVLEEGVSGQVHTPKSIPHKPDVGQSLVAHVKDALKSVDLSDGQKQLFGSKLKVVQEGSKFLITMPGAILFQPGSKSLSPAATRVLGKLKTVLKKWNHPLKVRGHSAADGEVSPPSALRLSLLRATAVVNFLQSRGIRASRLAAVGYGTMKPVGTHLTKAGRARNRRVEIVMVAEPDD